MRVSIVPIHAQVGHLDRIVLSLLHPTTLLISSLVAFNHQQCFLCCTEIWARTEVQEGRTAAWERCYRACTGGQGSWWGSPTAKTSGLILHPVGLPAALLSTTLLFTFHRSQGNISFSPYTTWCFSKCHHVHYLIWSSQWPWLGDKSQREYDSVHILHMDPNVLTCLGWHDYPTEALKWELRSHSFQDQRSF